MVEEFEQSMKKLLGILLVETTNEFKPLFHLDFKLPDVLLTVRLFYIAQGFCYGLFASR